MLRNFFPQNCSLFLGIKGNFFKNLFSTFSMFQPILRLFFHFKKCTRASSRIVIFFRDMHIGGFHVSEKKFSDRYLKWSQRSTRRKLLCTEYGVYAPPYFFNNQIIGNHIHQVPVQNLPHLFCHAEEMALHTANF